MKALPVLCMSMMLNFVTIFLILLNLTHNSFVFSSLKVEMFVSQQFQSHCYGSVISLIFTVLFVS